MLSIVVIYCKNDRDLIFRLMDSCPKWAEIIICETKPSKARIDLLYNLGQTGRITKAVWYYPEDRFDFAKAKNAAKSLAKKKWILSLDADEYLDITQHKWLYDLLNDTPDWVGGYKCTQWSWMGVEAPDGSNGRLATTTVRLFRNIPPITFTFPIHEVVDLSIEKSGYEIGDCKLNILHSGYEGNREELCDKLWRNIDSIWKHPELRNIRRYREYLTESIIEFKRLGGKDKWQQEAQVRAGI